MSDPTPAAIPAPDEPCPNCGCLVREHKHSGIGLCHEHACEDCRYPTPAASDDLFTDAYASWNPMQATDEPDGRPDIRIVPLIDLLRLSGFVTLQSCSGHPGFDGHICFDPRTVPASWKALRAPFSTVRETYHPEPWFELWWKPGDFDAAKETIRDLVATNVADRLRPRYRPPTQTTDRRTQMAETQLDSIIRLPFGQYQANRYDTDTEHVLTLWRDGETWDVRVPRPSASDIRQYRPCTCDGRPAPEHAAALDCGCAICRVCKGFTEWNHDDSL